MKARDKWIHVKVSGAEREAWQAAAEAEGMTLSDLIRTRMAAATVDREPQRRRAARRTDPALLAAVARVGNNLNQVARWANTYKRSASVIPVMAALVALERAVRDVLTHQGTSFSIAPKGVSDSTADDSRHGVEGEGHPGKQRDIPSLLPIQHGQASEHGGESC